jgi:sporulation protein YlmC with PRC-barrel domain
MRLGEIYDAPVRTEEGERLGCVHEVYVEGGRVVRLGVGAANLLERLLYRRRGKQVAWEDVVAIQAGTIIVAAKKKRKS